jgi:hypothetical protein
MRKFGRLAVSSIIGMTPEERLGHIEYYRTRMQELHDMHQWTGADAADARAMISTKLVAFDRMLAILEDPKPKTQPTNYVI